MSDCDCDKWLQARRNDNYFGGPRLENERLSKSNTLHDIITYLPQYADALQSKETFGIGSDAHCCSFHRYSTKGIDLLGFSSAGYFTGCS
jgi:hypothetical protein